MTCILQFEGYLQMAPKKLYQLILYGSAWLPASLINSGI